MLRPVFFKKKGFGRAVLLDSSDTFDSLFTPDLFLEGGNVKTPKYCERDNYLILFVIHVFLSI